jgi:hypothetical protein
LLLLFEDCFRSLPLLALQIRLNRELLFLRQRRHQGNLLLRLEDGQDGRHLRLLGGSQRGILLRPLHGDHQNTLLRSALLPACAALRLSLPWQERHSHG